MKNGQDFLNLLYQSGQILIRTAWNCLRYRKSVTVRTKEDNFKGGKGDWDVVNLCFAYVQSGP